jgi:site-specific recombinase XerD
MNLPLEKLTHSLIPKAQPKIEVPTKSGSKTIINAVVDPIADLKAQLKSHLAKSVDQDLINRIQMMAASKFLLESKEFDSVENIAQHIRKTLSLSVLDEFEENGPSLITNWALGLLQFPALLLPLQNKQSTKQIERLKQFYCAFLSRLLRVLKTQASTKTDGIRALFELTDQWRLDYEQITHTGFNETSNIRVGLLEPNAYAQEDEAGYLCLMHIFSAFEKGELSSIPWRELNPKAQFGGYLFFDICLSGVTTHSQLKVIADMSLMRQSLDAPLSSLLLPIDSSLRLGEVYDLEKLESGHNQTDRWIADPVSVGLYQRLRKNWKFGSADSNFYSKCIQEFLGTLKTMLQEQSSSSKSSLTGGQIYLLKHALLHFSNTSLLISASKAYQRRTLPGFVWHRLARDFDTKGLGYPSLERLNVIELAPQKRQGKQVKVKMTPTDESASEEEINPYPTIDLDLQNHWAQSILDIADEFAKAKCDAPTAIAQLEQNKALLELPPETVFPLLSDWAGWLIANINANSNEKNRGELELVKIFLPPMVQTYEMYADFQDIDAESSIDEYDVLETESHYNKKDQEKLRQAWNSFYQYLIEIGQIQKDQFTPIKKDSKLSRVGSAYISEPEFELARETLYSKNADSPQLRNICLVVLTLAYRLGLRRSEVVKLSTAHISFLNGAMCGLSVQWWIERGLKTASSTRIIPIKALLSEREMLWLELITAARARGLWSTADLLHVSIEKLKKYIQNCKTRPIATSHNFLFIEDCYLGQRNKATAQVDKIITLIHEAIRSPGGSAAQLRFHHLRHSCACNTSLLLLGKHLPNSKKYLFNLMYGNLDAIEELNAPDRGPLAVDFSTIQVRINDFELRSTKAREVLLAGDDSSGSDLYAVSRLLGHSSPMTTLTSYIHVTDVLVGAFLNERFCAFPERLQLAIHPDFKSQLEARKKSLEDMQAEVTLLSAKVLGRPKKIRVIKLKLPKQAKPSKTDF